MVARRHGAIICMAIVVGVMAVGITHTDLDTGNNNSNSIGATYEAYAQQQEEEDDEEKERERRIIEEREKRIVQQKPIISVTTDKTEYEGGDVIIISGEIEITLTETPVILQIFKDNNPIYINQITPAGDNTYWDIVKAQGVKWTRAGEYEITIRYGTDGKAVTKFNYIPGTNTGGSSGEPPIVQNIEVDAGNETFDVIYSITGGTIVDMTLDWRDFTLVVDISATENRGGTVTMEMPRKYIGAETSRDSVTTDEMFIILIDGAEVAYEEESPTNSGARKISIDFAKGDSEVRVIGTYAVPEFEHIIIMAMLAAGMLATIILLRTRYAAVQSAVYCHHA